MSWDGEGRRPYSDKKQEKERYRKLTLAILKEASLHFLDDLDVPQVFSDKAKEAQKLSGKHVARRRAERRMVELMRQMDEEVIESIESLIGKSDQLAAEKEQRIIRIRTQLLEGDNIFFAEFISQYPNVDIQRLRQYIRNVQKDIRKHQKEDSDTEIFQKQSVKNLSAYLREIIV